MNWQITSDRPVYLQLVEEIQMRVIAGVYVRGLRIPSVRDLAQEAKVNPNTMQKALTELERTGLVTSQRTAGKFITDDEALILRLREQISAAEITAFLERMKKYGFTREEIAEKLRAQTG
ncbi:MAG: GntR family transcriptional regulator [Oscillospiraceae bacterium]